MANVSDSEIWLGVTGDGGGAHEDEKRGGPQGDGGQIYDSNRPHEAAGEKTQTHHQQVQVRASVGRFTATDIQLNCLSQIQRDGGRSRIQWINMNSAAKFDLSSFDIFTYKNWLFHVFQGLF